MPQKVWELQKEALRQIGRTAVEHSVLACLENMISMKEFLCRQPEELIGMTEGIEGIGMTFDFGHANTMGKVHEFLPFVHRANHIHIHDNHGMSDEHLPLGAGTINWDVVGKNITANYSGVVVVEGRSVEEARTSLAVFRKCFV
jgi:sugar phosphate isomerase/epimerase